MVLVGFECPQRDENKLLFEKENLDSVLKSISTWQPAWALKLKMWILKKAFHIWRRKSSYKPNQAHAF